MQSYLYTAIISQTSVSTIITMSDTLNLAILHPAPSRSSTTSSLSTDLITPETSLPGSSTNSPNSSTSELSVLSPPTPDVNPYFTKHLHPLSLLPAANPNGPKPQPALAQDHHLNPNQKESKISPVRTKTNTRLPDLLPAFNDIRFDPSGGPFPVFGNGTHASDPHGLNAYLLHPDDGMWNYLQPAPRGAEAERRRSSATANGSGNGSDSDSEKQISPKNQRRESGKRGLVAPSSAGMIGRSPLSGPPILSGNGEPNDFGLREKKDVATDSVGTTSSLKSKFGLKKGLKLVKSGTNLSAQAQAQAQAQAVKAPMPTGLPKAVSQPSSPTGVELGKSTSWPDCAQEVRKTSEEVVPAVPAIPQRFQDVARSEVIHSRATTASSDGGPVTPDETVREDPDLTVLTTAGAGAGAGKEKRPGVSGGWKSWLGVKPNGKQRKKSKEGVVLANQSKTINAAPAVDAGLSADPLAGVLPSSIPLKQTSSINEPLNLTPRTRSPMPDQLRAVRNMSIKKLGALRAPSPHPVLPETSIPAYLAHHASDSSSAASYMKFPRSINCVQIPGMGLGPAQAGMRIDVAVRALLGKIDGGSITDLSEIKALAPALREKRFPNGLGDLVQIKRMKSLNAAKRTPGIVAFLRRPGFEDRLWVHGSDGSVDRIRSDRAVYEIEFSMGLEALGNDVENVARDALGRSDRSRQISRQSSFDVNLGGQLVPSRPRTISRESVEEEEEGRPSPEIQRDQTTPTPTPIEPSVTPTPQLEQTQPDEVKVHAPRSPPARAVAAPEPVAMLPLKRPSPTRARTSAVQWKIASESESEDSESEEESESDEQHRPLAKTATRSSDNSASRVATALPVVRPTALKPSTVSRPSSLAMPSPANQAETARRNAVWERRVQDAKKQAEADMANKYREHVMQTRERRELSRTGVVERQRTAEGMRDQDKEKRHSTSSSVKHGHRKSQSAQSSPAAAASANSLHQQSSASPTSANTSSVRDKRISMTSHSSAQNISSQQQTPNLANRRSVSHHDVRQMAQQGAYGMPGQMMPGMAFNPAQPGVVFMPVPIMPYGGNFMPMGGAPQMPYQHPSQYNRERRKSANVPTGWYSGQQQQPAVQRKVPGGRSGRNSPVQ